MLKFGICSLFKHSILAASIGLAATSGNAQLSARLELKTQFNGEPREKLSLNRLQGPESGGGGGVVHLNRTPHLVDYFLIPQALPQIQKWDAAHSSAKVESASDEPFEFSYRNQQVDNAAFAMAFSILEKWAALPFDRVAYLMQASLQSPLQWMFIDETLSSAPPFRPPALASDIPILTAANYTILPHKLYLVRIARPVWNEMALFHQAGLIVHEILRQVQLGKQTEFNDEALQKATTILMLCKPSVKLNQYAHFLTLNAEALATDRLGSFEEVTKDCRGPE